ncbi:MAG: arsenate reductase (glutaredoxin) [Bacteroidales bacterium]
MQASGNVPGLAAVLAPNHIIAIPAMIKIYHNPRCKKSRAGLAYLKEQGIEPEVRLYLTDPLTPEELKKLIMKLNIPASELVRKQEEQYKKELKGLNFNDDEWIRIYLENPKLIRRPIVEARVKAVIGDPVEKIRSIL